MPTIGRPTEKLLRALLLFRSERMLMEQLDYNLLFRWFVGRMDDVVWVPVQQEPGPAAGGGRRRGIRVTGCARRASRSCCRRSTSRPCWRRGRARRAFRERTRRRGRRRRIRAIPRLPQREADQRNTPTRTLGWPGRAKARRPSYAGHVLMENRNGLVVNVRLTQARPPSGKRPGDGGRHSGPEAGDGGCRQELNSGWMVQQLRERKTPH